ncbi:MAG: hypothetical protein ACPGEF_02760, partial [Endozoicomonas sp.]
MSQDDSGNLVNTGKLLLQYEKDGMMHGKAKPQLFSIGVIAGAYKVNYADDGTIKLTGVPGQGNTDMSRVIQIKTGDNPTVHATGFEDMTEVSAIISKFYEKVSEDVQKAQADRHKLQDTGSVAEADQKDLEVASELGALLKLHATGSEAHDYEYDDLAIFTDPKINMSQELLVKNFVHDGKEFNVSINEQGKIVITGDGKELQITAPSPAGDSSVVKIDFKDRELKEAYAIVAAFSKEQIPAMQDVGTKEVQPISGPGGAVEASGSDLELEPGKRPRKADAVRRMLSEATKALLSSRGSSGGSDTDTQTESDSSLAGDKSELVKALITKLQVAHKDHAGNEGKAGNLTVRGNKKVKVALFEFKRGLTSLLKKESRSRTYEEIDSGTIQAEGKQIIEQYYANATEPVDVVTQKYVLDQWEGAKDFDIMGFDNDPVIKEGRQRALLAAYNKYNESRDEEVDDEEAGYDTIVSAVGVASASAGGESLNDLITAYSTVLHDSMVVDSFTAADGTHQSRDNIAQAILASDTIKFNAANKGKGMAITSGDEFTKLLKSHIKGPEVSTPKKIKRDEAIQYHAPDNIKEKLVGLSDATPSQFLAAFMDSANGIVTCAGKSGPIKITQGEQIEDVESNQKLQINAFYPLIEAQYKKYFDIAEISAIPELKEEFDNNYVTSNVARRELPKPPVADKAPADLIPARPRVRGGASITQTEYLAREIYLFVNSEEMAAVGIQHIKDNVGSEYSIQISDEKGTPFKISFNPDNLKYSIDGKWDKVRLKEAYNKLAAQHKEQHKESFTVFDFDKVEGDLASILLTERERSASPAAVQRKESGASRSPSGSSIEFSPEDGDSLLESEDGDPDRSDYAHSSDSGSVTLADPSLHGVVDIGGVE